MAFVLSSVSGNLISAASAGYAPTNSGDVSAIASSYQVVSATGTQLYAGTTYVTSVNEATISAVRAGRAGNATLATSAYYDTNARFISALPDSAAVSAIASAYAESAASSKQDTLAFAYNTANQISSINGSALGGMDDAAVSAIASAYAESAASGKQDTLTFSYDDDKISAINGSALAGQGGGIDSATCSAIASAYAESAVSSVSGDYYPMTGNPSVFALSSDVSATVDLVGTQSANWGGSALALSAGPGVKLEKSGNTLIASTDETVLWSGSANTTTFSADLPENVHNFKYLEIYAAPSTAYLSARVNQCTKFVVSGDAQGNGFYYVKTDNMESNIYYGEILYVNMYNGGNSFTFSNGCKWVGTALTTGISSYRGAVTMIVGISRTAGV